MSERELLQQMVDAIEGTREGTVFYPELVFSGLPDGWLRDAKKALKEKAPDSGHDNS